MPASPHISIARIVAREAAVKFARLLPINMTPSNLSGRLRSESATFAPLFPCFLRCFNRYLLRAIMAVSDPEKYADIATSRQIAPKTAPIDELSKNLCLH